MHASAFLNYIIHYKYWLIFPIAVLEGPVIGMVTGFLASIHYLNFWIGYVVLVVGDLVGDSLYYLAGRYGRVPVIEKYGHHVGITADKLTKMEQYFQKNKKKTLIFGKFAHGTGSIMWISAGLARMDYYTFLIVNTFTTAVKVMVLMLIGFYFGQAYQSFNHYLNYAAIVFIVLLIALYVVAIKTNFLDKFSE